MYLKTSARRSRPGNCRTADGLTALSRSECPGLISRLLLIQVWSAIRRQPLLNVQNPIGNWPAFVGDDHLGSWTTSLVLIALRSVAEASGQRLHGGEWLIRSEGKESNWFWKWKFRTTDRHVRFDPDKWPWIPDTNSWVVGGVAVCQVFLL